MADILAVTVPFFALVAIGWLAGRRGLLPETAIPGLNAYVLFFALPAMLFRFGLATPLRALLDPVLLALYAACAVLVVGGTLLLTWRPPRALQAWLPALPLRDAAFGALVAAFPNSGFMGVPLLLALAGPAGAGPTLCSLLVDLFLTSTLCIGLAQMQGAGPGSHGGASGATAATPAMGPGGAGWAAAARALRGALTNPLPWSIAAGAALRATGWHLPGPVDKVLAMLGDSATPVALFTIGAVLWRAGLHGRQRTPVGQVLPVALVKLFVHPALVYGLGLALREAGAPLGLLPLQVLTLAAALPSASNAALLTERYRADSGRVARIILVSTVLAFLSFSLLAWQIGLPPRPQGGP